MTSLSDSLINYDRMFRNLECRNPTHGIITVRSNETQPKCPVCDNLMVAVIKSALTGEVIDTPREK